MNAISLYLHENDLTLEEFGAIVGFGKSSVSKWKNGKRPSPENAVKIEEATGIPRWKLRPDLFDAPAQGSAAA